MKRPIAPIMLGDVQAGQPQTPPPVVMQVRPEELLVDDAYQRDLSEASIRLIRKIVAEWDWRKFKSPVVAMTDEGPVVLDGQHTATAAATHPMIEEIPVLLVEAAEQVAQAKAFVGMNTTRLGMTAAQIHAANITAGDEAALAIDRVCVRAGIRVLRLPPARAVYKPGETIAVAAIAGLVQRGGEDVAAQILTILSTAGLGPVSSHHMRAVEALLTDDEFAELDPEELPRIIRTMGIEAAEKEGARFSATHGVPRWKGLAATWFKARKASRKAKQPAIAAPPIEHPQPEEVASPEPAPAASAASRARHAEIIEAAKKAFPAPSFSGLKR